MQPTNYSNKFSQRNAFFHPTDQPNQRGGGTQVKKKGQAKFFHKRKLNRLSKEVFDSTKPLSMRLYSLQRAVQLDRNGGSQIAEKLVASSESELVYTGPDRCIQIAERLNNLNLNSLSLIYLLRQLSKSNDFNSTSKILAFLERVGHRHDALETIDSTINTASKVAYLKKALSTFGLGVKIYAKAVQCLVELKNISLDNPAHTKILSQITEGSGDQSIEYQCMALLSELGFINHVNTYVKEQIRSAQNVELRMQVYQNLFDNGLSGQAKTALKEYLENNRYEDFEHVDSLNDAGLVDVAKDICLKYLPKDGDGDDNRNYFYTYAVQAAEKLFKMGHETDVKNGLHRFLKQKNTRYHTSPEIDFKIIRCLVNLGMADDFVVEFVQSAEDSFHQSSFDKKLEFLDVLTLLDLNGKSLQYRKQLFQEVDQKVSEHDDNVQAISELKKVFYSMQHGNALEEALDLLRNSIAMRFCRNEMNEILIQSGHVDEVKSNLMNILNGLDQGHGYRYMPQHPAHMNEWNRQHDQWNIQNGWNRDPDYDYYHNGNHVRQINPDTIHRKKISAAVELGKIGFPEDAVNWLRAFSFSRDFSTNRKLDCLYEIGLIDVGFNEISSRLLAHISMPVLPKKDRLYACSLLHKLGFLEKVKEGVRKIVAESDHFPRVEDFPQLFFETLPDLIADEALSQDLRKAMIKQLRESNDQNNQALGTELSMRFFPPPEIAMQRDFDLIKLKIAVRTRLSGGEQCDLLKVFSEHFDRLNLNDSASPLYVGAELLPSGYSASELKNRFLGKIEHIQNPSDSEDVYRFNRRNGLAAKNTMSAISSKLNDILKKDPESYCAQMITLINGFVNCETGQSEALDAVYQSIVMDRQFSEDTELEDVVRLVVSDAKQNAFLNSAYGYGGVHGIARARQALDPFIGLPHSVEGFEERVSRLHHGEETRILADFFSCFTRKFLIEYVANQFESNLDRGVSSRLVELKNQPAKQRAQNQEEISSLSNKLKLQRQERPLLGSVLLNWCQSRCSKDDDVTEVLKEKYDIDNGEYFDQPYELSIKTAEAILIDMGYLKATENTDIMRSGQNS